MRDQRKLAVRFVLNGERYELSRPEVGSRLAGVRPEPIRKHAVWVNDTWYPVRQAFEVATGIPRSIFTSHMARRHLVSLGFDTRGEINARTATEPAHSTRTAEHEDSGAVGDWYGEAKVEAAVVADLILAGWRILSEANTAAKERGIDVVAERDGQTVGIEVKGYPSRGYADPARAGESKPTRPSTQRRLAEVMPKSRKSVDRPRAVRPVPPRVAQGASSSLRSRLSRVAVGRLSASPNAVRQSMRSRTRRETLAGSWSPSTRLSTAARAVAVQCPPAASAMATRGFPGVGGSVLDGHGWCRFGELVQLATNPLGEAAAEMVEGWTIAHAAITDTAAPAPERAVARLGVCGVARRTVEVSYARFCSVAP